MTHGRYMDQPAEAAALLAVLAVVLSVLSVPSISFPLRAIVRLGPVSGHRHPMPFFPGGPLSPN